VSKQSYFFRFPQRVFSTVPGSTARTIRAKSCEDKFPPEPPINRLFLDQYFRSRPSRVTGLVGTKPRTNAAISIRSRIQGKVAGVEYVHFGFGNVLSDSVSGSTEIKRTDRTYPRIHQEPRLASRASMFATSGTHRNRSYGSS